MIEIKRDLTLRELRLFAAFWLPLVCAAIGVLLLARWQLQTAAIIVWAAGAALAAAGLALPPAAKVTYLGLMYAVFPIGYVVSHVVLAVVYFLVITPIGLVMRLAGRDLMLRRFADKTVQSYWHRRQPSGDPLSYFKQY
jgi:ABC-type uncharacterized transport system permease subunit